jgi:dTMP kinase
LKSAIASEKWKSMGDVDDFELDRGFFICCEGIDKSGKSTACSHLVDFLRLRYPNKEIVHVGNPGATPIGAKIRQLVKHELDIKLDPLTEQLMMLADYSAFINTILKPSLAEKKIVVADRSNFISGIAYGGANGLDINQFKKLCEDVGSPLIDILLVFTCPVEVARQRSAGKETEDRFESRGLEFQKKVAEIYGDIAENNISNKALMFADRFFRIDASQSKDDVNRQVETAVMEGLVEITEFEKNIPY